MPSASAPNPCHARETTRESPDGGSRVAVSSRAGFRVSAHAWKKPARSLRFGPEHSLPQFTSSSCLPPHGSLPAPNLSVRSHPMR